MNASEVLARYDAEVRTSPPPEVGIRHQWADGVLRATGTYNHIGWWSLTDDQVYALTAYLLAKDDVIAKDATLDAAALRAVKMPYADRFVPDDRRPNAPK